MKTHRFATSNLIQAAQLLRDGELVAFPTETVYGLGANAMSPTAVDKIYVAKGRPSDNPLIVHLSGPEDVGSIASEVPAIAKELMRRFWPGALTLVLPKRSDVPSRVTAGLDTVAVRIPNNPVALELIQLAGVPIAAPSANRSGRPSATTWQAVAEDLDGRVAGIVCGEPTRFGLESTVVDVTSNPPRILRPGSVSLEDLKLVAANIQPYMLSASSSSQSPANSPGLKHQHYQPRAKVIILNSTSSFDSYLNLNVKRPHYIGLCSLSNSAPFQTVLLCENASEYAAKLFDFFRQADLANADLVCCESVPEVGIGVALMDRLRRASQS